MFILESWQKAMGQEAPHLRKLANEIENLCIGIALKWSSYEELNPEKVGTDELIQELTLKLNQLPPDLRPKLLGPMTTFLWAQIVAGKIGEKGIAGN